MKRMETDLEPRAIYHEKQRLQFCLLHALNNLFQERDAFTRVGLHAIAERLVLEDDDATETSCWNPCMSAICRPHHNSLTGNYDANVLIAALDEKGKSLLWHDRRRDAYTINLEGDGLFGIIVNAPALHCFGLSRTRHWIALRRIEWVWYNLDSQLLSPDPFRDVDAVKGFLNDVLETGGEILLVMNDTLTQYAT